MVAVKEHSVNEVLLDLGTREEGLKNLQVRSVCRLEVRPVRRGSRYFAALRRFGYAVLTGGYITVGLDHGHGQRATMA